MDNDRKPVQHTARDTQHGTSNVQSRGGGGGG